VLRAKFWRTGCRFPGIGVTGDFVQAAFIGIWLQAKESPPGDTAGSALYQSVLTNLQWSESELASKSRFLAEILDKGDLSMTFTVRAHNSAPQTYLVDKETVAAMAEKGVPIKNDHPGNPLIRGTVACAIFSPSTTNSTRS
jgi:hypothetical protein